MKIISKFRDFYDYKVAKYGVDEKLVYTRKTYCEYFQVLIGNISNINIDYRISEDDFNKNLKDDTKPIDEKNIHKILFIGEKLIHLFFTENGVYTHFDIKNENFFLKKQNVELDLFELWKIKEESRFVFWNSMSGCRFTIFYWKTVCREFIYNRFDLSWCFIPYFLGGVS